MHQLKRTPRRTLKLLTKETIVVIRGNLTIANELTEVARARDWISTLAGKAGISQQEAYELQLVVGEACTNAIKHAYDMRKGYTVELSATIDDDQISISIRDFGRKIDLQSYREPNLEVPSEGGYGIYLLRRLMDEVSFDLSHDEGNELTLVKHR